MSEKFWRMIFDMETNDSFKRQDSNCPPHCPVPKNNTRKQIDPLCLCGKPLLLYIPPGEHVHPCPVHKEYVIHGSPITM